MGKDEEAKAAIAKTKKEAEAKRKEIEEAGKEAVQAREDEAEKIKQEIAAIDERKNTMLNEHDAKVAAANEELKGQIDQISADTNKQLDEMEAQTVATKADLDEKAKKDAEAYEKKKAKIQNSLDKRLDALMKKEEEGKADIEAAAAAQAAKIKQ